MKKKAIIALLVSVVLITGCTGKGQKKGDNENLKFDVESQSRNSGADPYENPEILHDVSFCWIDKDLDLKKAMEEGEDIGSCPEKIEYDGNNIELRAYLENTSDIPFQYSVFMTSDGNIQKFSVDNEKETNSYVLELGAKEDKDIHISIDPTSAPFGSEGKLKVYVVLMYAKTDQLIDKMKNSNGYGEIYNQVKRISMDEISVTANSKENEKLIDKKENKQGEDSPKTFIDSTTGKPDEGTTVGLTLGDKFEKEKIEDGLINLTIKKQDYEKMYARVYGYGKHDARAFLMVDGYIVPAFNGEYFADYYQKAGVVHNILVDKDAIPSGENHIVLGLINYTDIKGSSVKTNNFDATYLMLVGE